LTTLDIRYTHIDYDEQFLLQKNAHLPRLLNLCIEYKRLVDITNNFRTVKRLDCQKPFVQLFNFHQYFPSLY